jgi:hypothetical protein
MAVSLFKWFSIGFFMLSLNAHSIRETGQGGYIHPLYVSVTEFNHNAKDKIVEISCKIFTNDFETALEKTYHVKVDLSSPQDKKAADKMVGDYIIKHLQLKVDGKSVALEFVGSEKETDATWSYFQVSNMPSVKKIEINNSLLYETFDGQINIMHVSVGGNRQSTKVSNPDAYALFQF